MEVSTEHFDDDSYRVSKGDSQKMKNEISNELKIDCLGKENRKIREDHKRFYG